MRLRQSVRYTMYGIMYAMCFLLHGISSAEDVVHEHGSLTISKASIEPEGKAINTYTRHRHRNFITFFSWQFQFN